MREIGSEFWEAPVTHSENGFFSESVTWYLSGRVALKAILKELGNCHTAALPSWCCDSMIEPFLGAGMNVRFYPVYLDHGLVQEPAFDCDILLLLDYFGHTAKAPDLSGYEGVVIRDVTHSIFCAAYSDADYYFGSLRKWCGVWTGGFAWTKDGHQLTPGIPGDRGYAFLRDRAMTLKRAYLANGGVLGVKEYLDIFREAEDILEQVDIVPAQMRDIRLASMLDVERIRSGRRTNADVLRSAFPDWLMFHEMGENDCPLFVPILVPDGKRDALRQYLIAHEIYCPAHWPVSEYHRLASREKHIYDNELSLVCDQRYRESDMQRIVNTIAAFMKEF